MSAAIGRLSVSFSCNETVSGVAPSHRNPAFGSIEKEAVRGPVTSQGFFGHVGLGLMFLDRHATGS